MNVKDLIPIDGDSGFVQSLQHSAPIIGTVAGIACIIGGSVLLWKASRKHDKVMKEIREDLDDIHAKKPELPEEGEDEPIEVEEDQYTMKDYRKDISTAYLRAAWKLTKLYGPAVAAEFLGILLVGGSFKETNDRYVASAASCAFVTKGFEAYRKNVRGTLGEEADREFYYGIKEKTMDVPVTDEEGKQKFDKEGNPKTRKEKVNVLEGKFNNDICYARMFGKDTSTQFEWDSETGRGNTVYNLKYINDICEKYNKILQLDGHVWLSDVYEDLGFEANDDEEWIRYVGWTHRRHNEIGDNKIIFTTTPVYANDGSRILDYILIDFNCDGDIRSFVFPKSKRLNK